MENKNNKKVIAIILLVVIAIWAVTILIVKFAKSSSKDNSNKGNFIKREYYDNDIVKETIDLDEIKRLNIELASMDLIIETGDSYKLEYSVAPEQIPEITKGDTLTIKEPSYTCSIDFFLKQNNIYYKLIVPKNCDLKDASVKLSSGDIFIDSVNFNGEIKTTSGDIYIANIKSDKLDIKCSSGSTTIKDSVMEELKHVSTSGNLIVSNLEGESIKSKCSSADIIISDTKLNKIDLETSSGDINIELFKAANIKCNASSGNVKVLAPYSEEDYDTYLKSSSGYIKYNNKSYEDEVEVKRKNKERSIYAETSSGDISVSFRE